MAEVSIVSSCSIIAFLRRLGHLRGIESKDCFAFLHHVKLVAGDGFNIFLVVFQEVDFSFALFAQRLLGDQLFLILQEIAGHLISASDFGIEPQHDARNPSREDQDQQHAIERIPEGRIACPSRFSE